MSVKVPPTSTSMVLRTVSGASRTCSLAVVDKAVLRDGQLAVGDALLQLIYIDLDVVRDRVPRRQVLRLDLGAAPGTVELDDAHPLGIRGEGVLALDEGLVDLARVALVDEAALLVVAAGRAEAVPAHVAVPALVREVEVQILRYTKPFHLLTLLSARWRCRTRPSGVSTR